MGSQEREFKEWISAKATRGNSDTYARAHARACTASTPTGARTLLAEAVQPRVVHEFVEARLAGRRAGVQRRARAAARRAAKRGEGLGGHAWRLLRGRGGGVGPRDREDEVVVAVAIELGDGRGGVLLLEEVDEGEAAALLRLAILGQVDALDGAWAGRGGVWVEEEQEREGEGWTRRRGGRGAVDGRAEEGNIGGSEVGGRGGGAMRRVATGDGSSSVAWGLGVGLGVSVRVRGG